MKLSIVDQSPVPAGQTTAQALQNTLELARLADRLGYERYWVAEHHSTGSYAGTAPELLITRIAAETSSIRVGSGAVLLPYYAPLKVAESFRFLHALYPNRIDLGIGRGAGGTPLETYALQRREKPPDDFPERLIELLAFLEDEYPSDHPFSKILVQPKMPGGPDVWLLGSSAWSADAAAQLGLPFAFAHFINPIPTRDAIAHYRQHFQPSTSLSEPKVIVAASAIAADSQEEAELMHTSYLVRRVVKGDPGPVPTPEDARRLLASLPAPPRQNDEGEWPAVFYGPTADVCERLAAFGGALDVDELMLINVVYDHEARLRSYELLADAFKLPPRSTPVPSR